MVEIRPVIMEQEKYFPLLQEIEPVGRWLNGISERGNSTS